MVKQSLYQMGEARSTATAKCQYDSTKKKCVVVATDGRDDGYNKTYSAGALFWSETWQYGVASFAKTKEPPTEDKAVFAVGGHAVFGGSVNIAFPKFNVGVTLAKGMDRGDNTEVTVTCQCKETKDK
jgi:hypothetical protein